MDRAIYISRREAEVLLLGLKTLEEGEEVRNLQERIAKIAERLTGRLCLCGCGREVEIAKTGRKKLYFSEACKTRQFRARRKLPPPKKYQKWTVEEEAKAIHVIVEWQKDDYWKSGGRERTWEAVARVTGRKVTSVASKYEQLRRRGVLE